MPEDTRIVVNAPAYRLDVFQAGKLIKSYRVAIGNPEFPLPSGLRKADSIIFNPTWIPPNEPWVESSKTVKVGKEIAAGDRLNPLGVIKIPIGSPSLIHGGKTPAQIGAFATHGCVGMTDRQVQDFAKLLARLGNVELSDREIAEHQKARSETKEMKLKTAIPVELRYETITVEGGNLHIYRDVYGRGTNSRERLESILKAYGGTLSGLTEVERTRVLESLKTMTQGAGGRAGSGNGRVRQGRGQQVVIVPVTSLAGKGQPVPVALDTGAGGGKPAVQKRKRI